MIYLSNGMTRCGGTRKLLAAACFLGGLLAPMVVFAQVNLGSAADFSVLGASTVTNTGPSTLTGDLGVAPGSAITGFPPGVVVGGTIHAADATADLAQSDLGAAYIAAAGLICTTPLGGTLDGLTLTPGVYCVAAGATLSGTLTLDYQGDPGAVFVIQIGSSLSTAPGSVVVVSNNGGNSCASNVTWQVGTSATLGTASTFAGNILALASVTLNTGAQLDGRALARNGAVTLDTNAVTACTIALPPVPVAPAIQLFSAQTTAAFNGAASALDGQLGVTDADSVNLASATVSISQGFVGTDVLAAQTQSGITASYDATTGVLSLNGVAPVSDYEAVLRSVSFRSGADPAVPPGGYSSRTISFMVSDGVVPSPLVSVAVTVGPASAGPLPPPIVTPIPTLSSWALIGLSALLVLSVPALMRRR